MHSFCSWSHRPVQWHPPSLQYGRKSKDPRSYWQDAGLDWSQPGPVVTVASLPLGYGHCRSKGRQRPTGKEYLETINDFPLMLISVVIVATLGLEKSPEVWGKRRSWINNVSWKGSSAWKRWGLPGGQRRSYHHSFLWTVSLVSGSSITFPLDLYINTGIVLWGHSWWIAASLLPRYGKFCLEQLYINVSFNVDPSFFGLCKMQRTRWSVGHTAMRLSHTLLFPGKTHIFVLLELIEYYIFPISLCATFYITVFIGGSKWRIVERVPFYIPAEICQS